MPWLVGAIILVAGLSLSPHGSCDADESDGGAMPNVFDMPSIHARYLRIQQQVALSLQAKNYEQAVTLTQQSLKLVPSDPATHYNLACAYARLEKAELALAELRKAVEAGFRNVDHIKKDEDLAALRETEEFKSIVASAGKAPVMSHPWLTRKATPATPEKNAVNVDASNVEWDPKLATLRAYFKLPGDKADDVIKGHGRTGDLIREWYAKGTAAGNHGDFYDNHDRDHSNMKYGDFPQLTRIEYSESVRKRTLDHGYQRAFLFNTITLGNSSTAITSGWMWRSQPRLAYTNPGLMRSLAAQYESNHIYFYPEHRDHDAGKNGVGGYGDVYPANTPYLVISQGSSGSDRAFMDAFACTLAALQPDVKRFLAEHNAISPTLQMVFRMSNTPIAGSAERYLSGVAHPSVFNAKHLDVHAMVEMAHSLTRESVPPLVRLKVVSEDQPVAGRDFFSARPTNKLFDSPATIARVGRSLKYRRKMVVSAESSHDLNKRPLKYHWGVLRGDTTRIKITPRNESASIVELDIAHHTRQPIRDGHDMESPRVDIGCFVHNGQHYSAPGFVTFHFPANETRTYDPQNQRLLAVEYQDKSTGGNYEDPLVAVTKPWKDEYHYDDAGQLTGWTRTPHKGKQQEFTAAGLEIIGKTPDGELQTQNVRYAAMQLKSGPALVAIPTNPVP